MAIIIVIYSMLPDMDHPFSKISRPFVLISTFIYIATGHRGAFHSITLGILLALPLYVIFTTTIYFYVGILAYIGHLVMDLTTKTPFPIFYPYKKKFCLNWWKTGEIEYIFVLLGIGYIFF